MRVAFALVCVLLLGAASCSGQDQRHRQSQELLCRELRGGC